jgi:sugar diacid utilization regulator
MQRIHDYNPSIKLIILLRNPIDRAFSHWNMQRDRKTRLAQFLDAVKQEENRAREAYPLQYVSSRTSSADFTQSKWNVSFDSSRHEQVLVIKIDDLRRDYRAVTDRIVNFRVSPLSLGSRIVRKTLSLRRPMTNRSARIYFQSSKMTSPSWRNYSVGDCSDWKPS